MKPVREITKLLKKPFPIIESKPSFYKIVLALSLFVTFFLYIFQPFGISTLDSNKFLICLGFGTMTFLGATIYELLFHTIFNIRSRQKSWTFGKWIIDNLGFMSFISMANFLFARLLLFGYIEWNLFPQMMYSTFMIGILPLVALGALALFSNEKKYQAIAEEINNAKTYPSEIQDSENELIFNIKIDQIRYIEALQNYAKIGFINTEGRLRERIERTTLKSIVSETEGTSIIRCHRSYLVNKESIIAAAGNAQGLLLSLSDCDKIIPVSRTLVPYFRNQ